MTFETYLRQQADESQYGLMVVQTQIALDIANWIERKRNNEPSPERKKGEWILKPNIYGVAYCSECDYELHTDNTNYCPNCGADMRGEQNG